MQGLIKASVRNPHAVIVMALAIAIMGPLLLLSDRVPIDILPVFRSPAVQALTFYGGMPAQAIEKDITNRMERWTGQANGMKRQESRSILGASIVRNYFQDDQDPSGALTQVNSLALGVIPNLPPGTLPPVVLPFDPTSTTPVCLVTVSGSQPESILYDVGRYEVRNFIMQNPGAIAPVVIGGKIRAVMLYLDQTKMQARRFSPPEIMAQVDNFNLFFPSGDAKIGRYDYALSSNSMFKVIERMKGIPLVQKTGEFVYLGDVAEPKDSAYIQTNVVRVSTEDHKTKKWQSRRQVYIPVFRQVGASTLAVVENLKKSLPEINKKISHASEIKLDLVMDQSVYVKDSITALVREGVLGAILCSLVILMFLGQIKMTLIAIMTLPLSVFVSIICLYYTDQTINVMTLAGLTLAIGPMIDSAIICLENTHRYLSLGSDPKEAALNGTSEVAMPALIATLCTFLVLSPLALMPGIGKFLFLPMTLAVMFAMTAVYFLSLSLVPCLSAYLLQHEHKEGEPSNPIKRAFRRWEKTIDQGINYYVLGLNGVLKHPVKTVVIGFSLLAVVLAIFWPILRKDFFPEVDSGAFDLAARAPSGRRIEETEEAIKLVEKLIRQTIPKKDLKMVISEIGLTPDWSAAYTPNSGPQDAILKVQLEEDRERTSQEDVALLRKRFQELKDLKRFREAFKDDKGITVLQYDGSRGTMKRAFERFQGLEFSFNTGGLVRGALNEGNTSPINIQLTGKDQDVLFALADRIKQKVNDIDGIVDARVIQRPDYPELTIDVNRVKAAQLGLCQDDVMKSVIASTNSSMTYNKRNFWIDPITANQYFVGVQYPETKLHHVDEIRNIPIRSPLQKDPIPLSNMATIRNTQVPTEIHHVNIMPAIDLTMNVEGIDLGHVSVIVEEMLNEFGQNIEPGVYRTYDPRFSSLDSKRKDEIYKIYTEGGKKFARFKVDEERKPLKWTSAGREKKGEVVLDLKGQEQLVMGGARINMVGEYLRMQETFANLFVGLILACMLIYFLMVALDKSFIVPLSVMAIVPLCLVGILPMLYLTGSAVNVQSLLGFIFIVGIKVANTVLMTDFAQEIRRHEGLSPLEAIRKSASLRVRPVTMTALAAFFAMIPTAMAEGEANAPLARAILGGLLAGEPATLFVLPALYSLMVRDKKGPAEATVTEITHHH